MDYLHYNFDLWNTLIKANPEFKRRRTMYFHTMFLKRGEFVTGEQIEEAFRNVWKYSDALNQMNGKSMDALEMYAMIIFRLSGSLKNINMLSMELMYKEIENIFLDSHPTLYDEDTLPVLQELKSRGKTMSILSNTSFIRGATLEKVLDKLGIKDMFIYRNYSDEINLSKPNRDAFTTMWTPLPYDKHQIVHIGDNELADGLGAYEFGIDCKLINSTSLTIKDIL